MSTPPSVDDAGCGDIFAALVGIADTVKERHKLKSTPDDIRRFGFGERPAFETLIAEIDGQFAGCCLYFPSFSTWIGRPGVYVQDFYVAEAFRGQGVGERLLQRLAAVTRRARRLLHAPVGRYRKPPRPGVLRAHRHRAFRHRADPCRL